MMLMLCINDYSKPGNTCDIDLNVSALEHFVFISFIRTLKDSEALTELSYRLQIR